MPQPLWIPSDDAIKSTQLWQFLETINQEFKLTLSSYDELHLWSIENTANFWKSIWQFCNVKASEQPNSIFKPGDTMRESTWFEGARFNFAENLLPRNDNHIAIQFANEVGDRRTLTYKELHQQVSHVAAHLRHLGVKPGDRVAGFLPNMPETIIAMLATTSIGAVWSSCSPDFGLTGLIDRFGQIEPVVLFAVDGHYYNGKTFNHLEKIQQLQQQLPSLKQTIIVPYTQASPNKSPLKNSINYNDLPNITTARNRRKTNIRFYFFIHVIKTLRQQR